MKYYLGCLLTLTTLRVFAGTTDGRKSSLNLSSMTSKDISILRCEKSFLIGLELRRIFGLAMSTKSTTPTKLAGEPLKDEEDGYSVLLPSLNHKDREERNKNNYDLTPESAPMVLNVAFYGEFSKYLHAMAVGSSLETITERLVNDDQYRLHFAFNPQDLAGAVIALLKKHSYSFTFSEVKVHLHRIIESVKELGIPETFGVPKHECVESLGWTIKPSHRVCASGLVHSFSDHALSNALGMLLIEDFSDLGVHFSRITRDLAGSFREIHKEIKRIADQPTVVVQDLQILVELVSRFQKGFTEDGDQRAKDARHLPYSPSRHFKVIWDSVFVVLKEHFIKRTGQSKFFELMMKMEPGEERTLLNQVAVFFQETALTSMIFRKRVEPALDLSWLPEVLRRKVKIAEERGSDRSQISLSAVRLNPTSDLPDIVDSPSRQLLFLAGLGTSTGQTVLTDESKAILEGHFFVARILNELRAGLPLDRILPTFERLDQLSGEKLNRLIEEVGSSVVYQDLLLPIAHSNYQSRDIRVLVDFPRQDFALAERVSKFLAFRTQAALLKDRKRTADMLSSRRQNLSSRFQGLTNSNPAMPGDMGVLFLSLVFTDDLFGLAGFIADHFKNELGRELVRLCFSLIPQPDLTGYLKSVVEGVEHIPALAKLMNDRFLPMENSMGPPLFSFLGDLTETLEAEYAGSSGRANTGARFFTIANAQGLETELFKLTIIQNQEETHVQRSAAILLRMHSKTFKDRPEVVKLLPIKSQTKSSTDDAVSLEKLPTQRQVIAKIEVSPSEKSSQAWSHILRSRHNTIDKKTAQRHAKDIEALDLNEFLNFFTTEEGDARLSPGFRTIVVQKLRNFAFDIFTSNKVKVRRKIASILTWLTLEEMSSLELTAEQKAEATRLTHRTPSRYAVALLFDRDFEKSARSLNVTSSIFFDKIAQFNPDTLVYANSLDKISSFLSELMGFVKGKLGCAEVLGLIIISERVKLISKDVRSLLASDLIGDSKVGYLRGADFDRFREASKGARNPSLAGVADEIYPTNSDDEKFNLQKSLETDARLAEFANERIEALHQLAEAKKQEDETGLDLAQERWNSISDKIGMRAVELFAISKGFFATDVSGDRGLGYDVRLFEPRTGRAHEVEVKAVTGNKEVVYVGPSHLRKSIENEGRSDESADFGIMVVHIRPLEKAEEGESQSLVLDFKWFHDVQLRALNLNDGSFVGYVRVPVAFDSLRSTSREVEEIVFDARPD